MEVLENKIICHRCKKLEVDEPGEMCGPCEDQVHELLHCSGCGDPLDDPDQSRCESCEESDPQCPCGNETSRAGEYCYECRNDE